MIDPAATLWRRRGPLSTALLPLASLFGLLARRRRARLQRVRPDSPLPVVVIGNLVVGGSGKTPLVVAIVQALCSRSHRCGIVSRGYGGRTQREPLEVTAASDPADVGDEPVLLARATGVPVVVCVDRAAAVAALAARDDVDVVVADDGLQHYAMARAIEICVVDATYGLGNGRLLPAGPLREPLSRLAEVDMIALRDDSDARASDDDLPPGIVAWPDDVPRGRFAVRASGVRELATGRTLPLSWLLGRRVHAVAGIGRPERLFDALAAAGATVVPHAFPDHHAFEADELSFDPPLPIVMTGKDAVKVARLATVPDDSFELSVTPLLSPTLERCLDLIGERIVEPTPWQPA